MGVCFYYGTLFLHGRSTFFFGIISFLASVGFRLWDFNIRYKNILLIIPKENAAATKADCDAQKKKPPKASG
jgi:hypothetical protein